MPPWDITVFALLFFAAASLALCDGRKGKRAFLGGSSVALVAALVAAASLRWQIVPILVIAAISLAAGVWMIRQGSGLRRMFAVSIAALGLIAAAPYAFFPVFDLPQPDGPFRVGVRNADLHDLTRRGILFTSRDTPRDIPITVWYPAPADAAGKTRPYLTRRETLDEAVSLAELWGFPAYRFLSLHSTRTHGIENADIAAGQTFPIVIFSHGYWSIRAQNTALMERLASHGHIVVSVAHPRDSAAVQLQDGTLISPAMHFGPEGVGDPAADRKWEQATAAFMGGDSHEKRTAALPAYRDAVSRHRLGQSLVAWRDDVLFARKALQESPPQNMADIMAAADFSRVVHAGMSFGGSTAVSACDNDPSCVAAVDLDGENFDGTQFDRETRAPLLLLLTDQPFSELQHSDPAFNPTDYAWEKWHCIGDRNDIVRLRAHGILHMGLTDLVLSARGPFRSRHFTRLDGERALALVNDTTLAFLQHHVGGAGAAGFNAMFAKYPELQRLNTDSLRAFARRLPNREACADGRNPKQLHR